ncbi:MAG: UbiA family prenyltransferase [Prolixibacteraceae bacterium]
MKFIRSLINSNIYISLAAVMLTVSAQIQLGMRPQWHPYLFIIFFATLFEYNIHRLVTVLTNKEALNSEKHHWVRENLKKFYLLVFISMAGSAVVVFLTKIEILIALAPFAVLTLFYSIPVLGDKKQIFRLREIPYLKIFMIAFVWSSTTIILPIIQSSEVFNSVHVGTMLAERFFFIFAITIPFDIRDLEADQHSGLKTIPLLIHEKKAMTLSYLLLLIFFLISFVHYQMLGEWLIILALGISAITTYFFLVSGKIKKWPLYHYGILDGTMLFQGVLVYLFYFFR